MNPLFMMMHLMNFKGAAELEASLGCVQYPLNSPTILQLATRL